MMTAGRIGEPVPTRKDRMVIVCCGCGGITDLPAVTKLVEAHPSCIVYRATCACGFTHTIRVTRS
jgi:hypothetical protein